jgi:hypothetical protein
MSNSNTVLNLLREILRSNRNNTTSERHQPTREELVRRDYENMFKLINEYQYTMTEYQNNMHSYLLLLSSLQLQLQSSASGSETRASLSQSFPTSRGGNGNRNHVNTTFRPMNSNPLPPVGPTSTATATSATRTADTRRMFDSLVRTTSSDISGSGVIPMTARVAASNIASPAVNLIDVVFEYDGSNMGDDTDTAVQHLIDNDDFRNSILRAAGIEGGDNMMHWVMTPQYAGSGDGSGEDEPRGLTNEEIRRNTDSLVFRDDLEGLLSNTCPITMEDYVVGDRLLQLRTCRHAFRERELVEWFQRERTCPVCRTSYG